jgi:hypothetical protein
LELLPGRNIGGNNVPSAGTATGAEHEGINGVFGFLDDLRDRELAIPFLCALPVADQPPRSLLIALRGLVEDFGYLDSSA